MTNEKWVERILTGLSAVVGILFVIAGIVVGIAVLIWIEKAPEFLAIVISAAMIAVAIAWRKEPYKIYNLTVGHPETGEIIEALKRLVDKGERP